MGAGVATQEASWPPPFALGVCGRPSKGLSRWGGLPLFPWPRVSVDVNDVGGPINQRHRCPSFLHAPWGTPPK